MQQHQEKITALCKALCEKPATELSPNEHTTVQQASRRGTRTVQRTSVFVTIKRRFIAIAESGLLFIS